MIKYVRGTDAVDKKGVKEETGYRTKWGGQGIPHWEKEI